MTTPPGEVTLHVPRLKGVTFETAIIERYRRRESSTKKRFGVRRFFPCAINELNRMAYVNIENWRSRKRNGIDPYVYVDGIYLKRN